MTYAELEPVRVHYSCIFGKLELRVRLFNVVGLHSMPVNEIQQDLTEFFSLFESRIFSHFNDSIEEDKDYNVNNDNI